jgi:hypothetical protein
VPWVGFEPTIPVFEGAKTVHALDRAATVIDTLHLSIRLSVVESTVFWVLMPCSSERARRFGETDFLHLDCRRVNSACHLLLLVCCLAFFFSTLKVEVYVLPKRRAVSKLRCPKTDISTLRLLMTRKRRRQVTVFRNDVSLESCKKRAALSAGTPR